MNYVKKYIYVLRIDWITDEMVKVRYQTNFH